MMLRDGTPSMQGRAYEEADMLSFVLRIKESVEAGEQIVTTIEELVAEDNGILERSTGKKIPLSGKARRSAMETIRSRYYRHYKRFRNECDPLAMTIASLQQLGLPASTVESVGIICEVDAYQSPFEYRAQPKRGRPPKAG